jgi:hypothetical protein
MNRQLSFWTALEWIDIQELQPLVVWHAVNRRFWLKAKSSIRPEHRTMLQRELSVLYAIKGGIDG